MLNYQRVILCFFKIVIPLPHPTSTARCGISSSITSQSFHKAQAPQPRSSTSSLCKAVAKALMLEAKDVVKPTCNGTNPWEEVSISCCTNHIQYIYIYVTYITIDYVIYNQLWSIMSFMYKDKLSVRKKNIYQQSLFYGIILDGNQKTTCHQTDYD